jgi:hypothetical protein|tara:strand:+ start:329 stop:550 length:222 start_codon:yes stop_codon:yes gene_type:complete
MSSKSVEKFLHLFREMMGAGAVGAPTNNVGDGKIAGAAPGEDPPVYLKKKKRKPTPVGRYGTRRTWRQNGGTN